MGYRHFDSAQVYHNESLLGDAWRASGLAREEFFLTTKIAVTQFGNRRTPTSFSESLMHLQTEAYSPLAHARKMEDPIIRHIARKYDISYAQVMLRWCIERGLVVLPKSVTPARIAENRQLFAVQFDQDDMKQLAALDQDLRTCWSPVHVP